MTQPDNPADTPPGGAGQPPADAGHAPSHPGPQPPGQVPHVMYAYPPRPPYNGMAIASLAVSAGAILVCGLLAFVGSILGHVARKQIRETGEQGDGLALAGIIVGYAVSGLSLLLTVGYFGFMIYMFSTVEPPVPPQPTP